ncbi:thiamine pyrophosphate-binding protein [Actinoplanes sp. KI2]|uniref:thiamine pyrophosphate-binding protein n=1 Tax=Actinoplanes sp. KI2 TaxID=2983315 RepID=UPI0021D585E8|nr:thiamine pyrophosphate-binding protein [Actinoplanes sp. KI2]MCU7728504.1 thiamine pyrophosphate-binding protein [Actinoplanes sp. KI2]
MGTAQGRLVDRLVDHLATFGVDHVFGVGGANIEDLYDAIHRGHSAVRGVVAKHEFSAVTMADGYARATGRLGVVAATSGGGAMNLVPGLAEAHASRIPLLALVGQPPAALDGQGAFQESSGRSGSFDARRVFAPISRFCARVERPDTIGELLARAVAAALREPRGPAVLLLPKDVQQARVDAYAPIPPTPAPTSVDLAAVDRAVTALRTATGVLVIAGAGVAATDSRAEVAELARRTGAWVAVTPDAKDVFDNHDPRFVGVSGVMGHPTVADCLRRADLCLLVGTRLPMMARAGLDELLRRTTVICLDPETPFVAGQSVRGDVRSTLRALVGRFPAQPRPCPEHAGPRPLPAHPFHGSGTPYAEAIAAIDAALPDDAHVFVDAGNAAAAAIHLLPARRRGRFVVAVGMGGMGYAFGAGIGAALASGQRTFVLAGDGAFFMHGMEVHTAVEYDVPITFVIFNNNAHGMCVTREQLFYGDDYSYNLFRPTDIAGAMTAAFRTLSVSGAGSAEQLRRALRHSAAGPGPALVEVDVDPREVPPFLPFLTALGQHPDSEETSREHRPVQVG